MKKLSLLFLASGLFLFSCKEAQEATETIVEETTQVVEETTEVVVEETTEVMDSAAAVVEEVVEEVAAH